MTPLILIALFASDVGSELLLQTGHNQIVTDLQFANKSDVLASAGADGRVLFWNPASGLSEHLYNHPDSAVSMMAWSSDDKLLAVGNLDGAISVLRFPELTRVAQLQPSQKGDWTNGLAFAGNRLVVSTWAGVFAYDCVSWQPVPVASDVAGEQGFAVAHELSKKLYLSRQIGMFRKERNNELASGRASAVELDANTLAVTRWFTAPMSTKRVAISPDGEHLAGIAMGGTTTHQKLVYVWNTKTGALMRPLRLRQRCGCVCESGRLDRR